MARIPWDNGDTANQGSPAAGTRGMALSAVAERSLRACAGVRRWVGTGGRGLVGGALVWLVALYLWLFILSVGLLLAIPAFLMDLARPAPGSAGPAWQGFRAASVTQTSGDTRLVAPERERPAPRVIRSPRDAELVATEWMLSLIHI